MNFSLNNQWDNIRLQTEQLWAKHAAPRYDALSESEQRTVKIAAVVLPILIFIFGITLPILDQNTALKTSVTSLAKQVDEANHLADLLAAHPAAKSNSGNPNNMLSDVDKLARQTGVRTYMTRLRPQQVLSGKQRLQTQIKDVPYQKLTLFISALEDHGYAINPLKIQAAGVGLVHVQATIGK